MNSKTHLETSIFSFRKQSVLSCENNSFKQMVPSLMGKDMGWTESKNTKSQDFSLIVA